MSSVDLSGSVYMGVDSAQGQFVESELSGTRGVAVSMNWLY